MNKANEKLVAELNAQTDVIEKLREGLERIVELEDDDEAGAAKVIARELLASFDFIEGEEGKTRKTRRAPRHDDG